MSHTGNIVVKPADGIGAPFIFRTGRWSGEHTPRIAQEALQWISAGGGSVIAINDCAERSILSCICHSDCIDAPVRQPGNTDTPTVIIDLHSRQVFWKPESGDVKPFVWDLDYYVTLDIESVPAFETYFRQ